MKNTTRKYILNGVLLSLIVIGLAACSDISDAEHIKNAKTYIAEGSYRAAVVELKNAIQSNAKNKDFRFLLAQAYLKLGEGLNAEKELRRAKQLGFERSKIAIPLGHAFVLQGMYKKALKTLQQADIKSNKDKTQVLLLDGESYLGLSDYRNAEKTYIAAQKISRERPEPLLGRAKVAMQRGNLVQTAVYLRKAQRLAPDNIDTILFTAELYALKDKQAKAEENFKRALEVNKVKDFTRQKFQAMTGIVSSQILQKKLDAATASIDKLIKVQPRHPFVKYLQAWLAFQKKNYALANTLLLELYQKVPGYLPSLLLLGAANYALGNYEQANIYLSDFVNKVPTHRYARKLLAATQLKLNLPEKAMGTLQSGVKTTDAELITMMGQAAALTGNPEAHASYLRDAIKNNPGNLLLRKELAKTYMRQGNLTRAITELKFLHKENRQDRPTDLLLIYAQLRTGQLDNARTLARKILRNKPSDPDLQAVMGDIDLVAGKRNSARQHFHKALNLQKNHSYSQLSLARMDLEDGNLAEADKWFVRVLTGKKAHIAALLGRAQVAALEGNVDKMLSFLEKARAYDVRAVSPRVILARYYSSTGKVNLALEFADEIKQQYRSKNIGYQLEGDIYMRGRRYKEAQDAFQMAIKQEPSADLVVKLSRSYFLAGDTAKGLTILNKGLKKYPDGIGLRLALATYYQRVGNVASAEQNYRELLEQQPLNIVALNNMSSLLADKNPEKALSYAKQAYQLAPKNIAVTDTFGWLLVNHNQTKKGLKILTQAASQGNNPTVEYHLAFALVKNGKNKDAINILGPLVKSDIIFPERTEATKLLARIQIKEPS